MSEANKIQHGGSHYKTAYEHWDLVAEVGLNYFTGQVTKYVTRWRHKNGKEDLEKALHFLEKFIEILRENEEIDDLGSDDEHMVECITAEVSDYALANGLWEDEHAIVLRLSLLTNADDLEIARAHIQKLIRYATNTGESGTKTDSNKHAFQEGSEQ